MASHVVYFSRSGNSKRVAESIASQLGIDVVELKDHMDWHGLIGYLKAGYYTMKNKPLQVELSKELTLDSKIIIVSPLWVGGPAQAVRLFLKDRDLTNIALVLTSNASVANTLPNRDQYVYVGDIVKKMNNESMIIGSIVKRFNKENNT